MSQIFVVNRAQGEGWKPGVKLTDQSNWPEHAAQMDKMHAEGFALLAGPVANAEHFEAMMIVRAESEDDVRARFADDVWVKKDISRIVRVAQWHLRLGSLA